MADSRRHEAAAAAKRRWPRRAPMPRRRSARSAAPKPNCGHRPAAQSLKLLSPIDGVVTAREAEPGTTVVAGQAVLRLVDPAQLWVRARVDQARAEGVQVGQAADIVLRSAPGVPCRARWCGSSCRATP
jgi:HlyD family secretion protein